MSFENSHSLSGFLETGSEGDQDGSGAFYLHPQKSIDTDMVIEIARQLGFQIGSVQFHLGLFDHRQMPDIIKTNRDKYGIQKIWEFKNKEDLNTFRDYVELMKECWANDRLIGPTISYINTEMYHQNIISFNLYGETSRVHPHETRDVDINIGDVSIVRDEVIYVYLSNKPFLRCYDFLFELKKYFGPSFVTSTHSRIRYDKISGFIYYFSRNTPKNRYLSLEKLDWKRSFLNLGHFQLNSLGMLLQPVSYTKSFDHQQVKSLLEGEQEDSAFLEAIMWGEGHVRLPWREPFVEKSARYALKLRALTGCDILIGDHPLRPHDIEPFLAGPLVRGKHY